MTMCKPAKCWQVIWAVWLVCLGQAAAQQPSYVLPTAEPPQQEHAAPFNLYPGTTAYGAIRGSVAPLPGSQPLTTAPGESLVPAEPPVECPPQHPWRPCVTTGIRSWFSWGNSERSHAGPDIFGFFADDQRTLKWRNMTSEVLEVNVNMLWFDRLLVVGEVGAGAVSSGQLRDKEVIFEGPPGLSFESLHPAMDDDLFYFNVDLGWRFCECEYLIFDALAGYQYWSETYVAEGGLWVFPPLGPFPAGPQVTERFTWQGFRIGCQGIFMPEPRCVFKARVMCMPFTHFENRDTRHQDPDLLQDPSIIDSAAGGFGVMAELRAAYNLWKGLFVELGYRVWDVGSLEGETLFRFSDGSRIQLPFNGAQTTRHGLLFGFTYHF